PSSKLTFSLLLHHNTNLVRFHKFPSSEEPSHFQINGPSQPPAFKSSFLRCPWNRLDTGSRMTDGDLFQSITTSNSASPDPVKGRPRVFLKTDHRLFRFVLDEAMLQNSYHRVQRHLRSELSFIKFQNYHSRGQRRADSMAQWTCRSSQS
ncbi:hypothetical protein P692DRAFT_20897524, partial [Suillus brevipes Sb2]